MTTTAARTPSRGPAAIVLLLVLTAAAYAVRLTGPWRLAEDDQARPVSYAMDVLLHGAWIVQTDTTGAVASKPPLHAWAIAIASLPGGEVTRLTMTLPSALALAGLAVFACVVGRRIFGPLAGLVAGGVVICSSYGLKHVHLVRTDALFALLVALAACAGWWAWLRAHERRPGAGRGWLAFWILAAAATLTKGPLGLLFASVPLADALRVDRRSLWHPMHAIGAGGYVLLCGGWLALAVATGGREVFDTVVTRELLGHAVGTGEAGTPFSAFWKPWAYGLARFLPWSLFTVVALWRAIFRPAADPRTQRFEAMCWWWLVLGLAVLSISPHQRGDLALPLLLPAALLAGREIALLLRVLPARVHPPIGVAALVVCAALAWWRGHVAPAERVAVEQTLAQREFATAICASGADPEKVVFTGACMIVQHALGVKRDRVPLEEAAALLARPERAWVVAVVEDVPRLAPGAGVCTIATCEAGPGGRTLVLLSQRPAPAVTSR